MTDSTGFAFFAAAVVIVLGWFALGTQWNVRLGNRTLKWLQGGLPLVGAKTTLRWLGSSVVELKIAQAQNPFRSAELLIVLEPRDIPLVWAWAYYAQGRRDLVIFRTQLRAAPAFELEARSKKTWGLASAKRDAGGKWTVLPDELGGLHAAYRGPVTPLQLRTLLTRLELDGVQLTRLSVNRTPPNLQVHFLLPPLERVSAERLFTRIKQLGEEVLKT